MTKAYQPKTGARCCCRRGIERDNCAACEGTGWVIDFAAIRERVRQRTAAALKNPNCDNDKCSSLTGEVRVLPTGGDSNAILCHSCYLHEMEFRQHRNRALAPEARFALPAWESLKPYTT